MENCLYDAFISFAPGDQAFAAQLTDALRAKGCRAYDRRDVLVGEKPDDAMDRGLLASRFVILVLSVGAGFDDRTRRDAELAMKREREESRVVVLPTQIESCSVDRELEEKQRVDFRDPANFAKGVEALLRVLRPEPRSKVSGTLTITPPDVPSVEVPEDLVQACANGECVLFAGAGLSARAGIPVWNQFLADLLDHGTKLGVIEDGHSLGSALESGSRDEAADLIVQSFQSRPEQLQSFMQDYFAEPPK